MQLESLQVYVDMEYGIWFVKIAPIYVHDCMEIIYMYYV